MRMYRAGNFGYGTVKKALADAAEKFFETARAKRDALAANPAQVAEILKDGAARARKKANEVLTRAKKACGLL